MNVFLGLGAQRTATTWLFECLRSHPDIYMPDGKELQYFSSLEEENNAAHSQEWYLRSLSPPGGETLSGEITPEYLLDPESPRRIREVLDNPKLIVCIREPITRAISAYLKGLRENNWDCPLDKFLEENLDYCLDRGLYSIQINRYLDLFPRQDICLKVYDDISQDPKTFMQEIYRFLEVDPDFISPMLNLKFNIGAAGQQNQIRAVVFFRDLVYKCLGPIGRNWIIKAIQRTEAGNRWMQRLLNPTEGENKSYQHLFDRYRNTFYDDVKEMSLFLDRDLISLWGYDDLPN
jgi:hypothetical protein